MKRIAPLVVLLMIVLAGAWFLVEWGGSGPTLLEDATGAGEANEGQESRAVAGEGEPESAGVAAASAPREGAGRSSLDEGSRGEIRGRVIDQLSHPLSGARVVLHRKAAATRQGSQAPVLASAVSDAQGRFRMPGLELANYTLHASAKGRAATQVSVELSSRRPRRLGMVLKLDEGFPLQGVVVDAQGEAVAGAWVVTTNALSGGRSRGWQEVRSDAQGRFSFPMLSLGKRTLLSWAQGHALGQAMGDSSQESPVRVELQAVGPYKLECELEERGEDGSNKPQDVIVRLWSASATGPPIPLPGPIRDLAVPVEGKISSRGLVQGIYRVSLYSDQVVLKSRTQNLELSKKDPSSRLEISWSAAVGLSGKLQFENGSPAAGILLHAWNHDRSERYRARSDEQGSFELPPYFQPKAPSFVFFAEGGYQFDDAGSKSTWAAIRPDEKGKVLTVVPASLLSGLVVDAKGVPVMGAEVWLHAEDRLWENYGTTETNVKGEFTISITRSSKSAIVVDAKFESAFCPKPVPVVIKEEMPQDGLVIRLIEGASIEGQVVDEKRIGIAGARVWATFVPKKKPKRQEQKMIMFDSLSMEGAVMGVHRGRSMRTDSEGRFRIPGLAAGSWRVSARSELRMQRTPDPIVQLIQGEQRGGLRFEFSEGLSIAGTILDDTGETLAGVSISARFDGKLEKGDTGGRASTQSAKDGTFVLAGLRPGNFVLSARLTRKGLVGLGYAKRGPDGKRSMAAGMRIRETHAAGTKNLRWEVPTLHYSELRARIAHAGKPLQRIRADLYDGKKRWSFEIPIDQGGIRMEGVLAGDYELTFKTARFSALMVKIQVTAESVLDLGVLNLEEPEALEGLVTDAGGRPLAGVWISLDERVVKLWPKYDLLKGIDQFEGRVLTQSDAMGRFQVPMKPAMRIFGFKPGYAPAVIAYSPPPAKTGGAKAAVRTKRAPISGTPTLVLQAAGELSLVAPVGAKDKRVQWYGTFNQVFEPGSPKPKNRTRPLVRSLWLPPGKVVRLIGLPAGKYQIQAANMSRFVGFKKTNVPGESFFEELRIQPGTNRVIRIP